MTVIPLASSASGVLNSAGRGSVRMGPGVFGSSWAVDRYSVVCTSTTDTVCSVYRNVESDTALLDGTSNGNNDVSDTSIKLRTGESLLFVWENGDPGAVITATIGGDLETGR